MQITNFETLIYIYLIITAGTIFYPIQLWTRVNFLNFVFMVLLTAFYMITKWNFGDIISRFHLDSISNIYLFGTIFIGFIIARINFINDISTFDSLFLGFFPFIILFEYALNYMTFGEFNVLFAIIGFGFLYGSFVYQKLLFVLPFAVKDMSDRY